MKRIAPHKKVYSPHLRLCELLHNYAIVSGQFGNWKRSLVSTLSSPIPISPFVNDAIIV